MLENLYWNRCLNSVSSKSLHTFLYSFIERCSSIFKLFYTHFTQFFIKRWYLDSNYLWNVLEISRCTHVTNNKVHIWAHLLQNMFQYEDFSANQLSLLNLWKSKKNTFFDHVVCAIGSKLGRIQFTVYFSTPRNCKLLMFLALPTCYPFVLINFDQAEVRWRNIDRFKKIILQLHWPPLTTCGCF